jgi:hypothetical protein
MQLQRWERQGYVRFGNIIEGANIQSAAACRSAKISLRTAHRRSRMIEMSNRGNA